MPADRFAAISGPNLSKEIADRHPAATVVACTNLDNATKVAEACTTSYFKPFVTTDVIGLEMCGSLKNGSSLSRNYTFGANLGKGLTVEEATKVSNGVAEGVPTTDAVVALGDQLDVPTPLAYQMSRVLNEGISCSEMLAGLFGHEVTGE